MKCPKCGKEITEGAKYCTFCATPISIIVETKIKANVKEKIFVCVSILAFVLFPIFAILGLITSRGDPSIFFTDDYYFYLSERKLPGYGKLNFKLDGIDVTIKKSNVSYDYLEFSVEYEINTSTRYKASYDMGWAYIDISCALIGEWECNFVYKNNKLELTEESEKSLPADILEIATTYMELSNLLIDTRVFENDFSIMDVIEEYNNYSNKVYAIWIASLIIAPASLIGGIALIVLYKKSKKNRLKELNDLNARQALSMNDSNL